MAAARKETEALGSGEITELYTVTGFDNDGYGGHPYPLKYYDNFQSASAYLAKLIEDKSCSYLSRQNVWVTADCEYHYYVTHTKKGRTTRLVLDEKFSVCE